MNLNFPNLELSCGTRRENRVRAVLEEPLGYVQGQNLYQYVVSDPISQVDPEGLKSSAWHVAGTTFEGRGKYGQTTAQGHYGYTLRYDEASQTIDLKNRIKIWYHDGPKGEQLFEATKPSILQEFSRIYRSDAFHGWHLIGTKPPCDILVTFQIEFVRGLMTEADNKTIFYNRAARSDEGHWYRFDTNGTVEPPATYVHEIGHMFGLLDDYTDVELGFPGTPDQNQSIMGSGNTLLKRHVERIVLELGQVDRHLTGKPFKIEWR